MSRNKFCTLIIILSLLASFLLQGCNDSSLESSHVNDESSSIEVKGIQVPVFATAEEQLNYTRTWFARIQEKRASLEAFIRLYPREKKYCGLVELELAYLQLGEDYRFAYQHAGFSALKAYRAVLGRYQDFPEIMAKAHWYTGWIYSDLLEDRQKGVEEYWKIFNKFPYIRVSVPSPAPWVSIIYQADEDADISQKHRSVNSWAALSLVEIIRYTEEEEACWLAFVKLWHNYRDNVATGFGLRLMLQKRVHPDEVLQMAKEYMEMEFSNVHILGDIQKEIHKISRGEGGGVQ